MIRVALALMLLSAPVEAGIILTTEGAQTEGFPGWPLIEETLGYVPPVRYAAEPFQLDLPPGSTVQLEYRAAIADGDWAWFRIFYETHEGMSLGPFLGSTGGEWATVEEMTFDGEYYSLHSGFLILDWDGEGESTLEVRAMRAVYPDGTAVTLFDTPEPSGLILAALGALCGLWRTLKPRGDVPMPV